VNRPHSYLFKADRQIFKWRANIHIDISTT